ncbi:hypothetical protein D3C79_669140 [compost metagenome]
MSLRTKLVVSLLVAVLGASTGVFGHDAAVKAMGITNMKWPGPELDRIIKADDLHISVFRDDGVTYGTPTFIWCVQVDGELYVRAYNGVHSRWYQAALKQKAGKIIAAGRTMQVAFEPVSGALNDRIDLAYSAKYSASSYLQPMISERSRAATIRILPQKGTQ